MNTTIYEQPITLKNVLRFAIPTIIMTLFMSFYTMVDGLFVSNFIGTNALAAINLTAPIINVVTAISTMLATGGSAIVMRKIGAQKTQEAREDFTFLICINILVGLFMMVFGYVCMDMIFSSLHISAQVSQYCELYLGKYLLFTIPILLMNNFTLYMIASEKAALSMKCSICGGILNILLDYLFIKKFQLGIEGAAIATGLGYSVTAVVGFLLFRQKENLLHFVKPICRIRTLGKAATNGCSEMATTLVTGMTTTLFNCALLKYAGEHGVAAITIIMYVLLFATSLYTGYCYGIAPMISYYYGAKEDIKLKKLISLSLKIIGAVAGIAFLVSIFFSDSFVLIFTERENPVYKLAVEGNRLCSIALLFIGFNVFTSGLFTALSNGLLSAILAFSRSFVFMVLAMLLLPTLLGIPGIWLATPCAELAALALSLFMLWRYRKRYHYG